MRALVWHGKEDIRCDSGLGSRDRASARRHHQGDELRHLRLGPAPLPQLHPGDAARRHHGPRDDGRGGRGRLGGSTAASRRATASSFPSRSSAASATSASAATTRCARPPTARSTWPTRSSAMPRRACSATRTSPAAIRAARRNTCACRSPTPRTSRCPTASPTRSCSSSATSSRPAGRRRCSATSSPTDTVAVWGCGPVGQMAIRSAILLGAKQVVAIDRLPERLEMAEAGGAITINFDEESVVERLNELTGGKGPEKCIDAIGMEAHVTPFQPDTVLRPCQADADAGERPPARAARDDLCLPAGGRHLDPGRL